MQIYLCSLGRGAFLAQKLWFLQMRVAEESLCLQRVVGDERILGFFCIIAMAQLLFFIIIILNHPSNYERGFRT